MFLKEKIESCVHQNISLKAFKMASSVIITSRKLPRVVLRLSANSVFASNYGVSVKRIDLYQNFSIELCNHILILVN